VVYGHSHVEVEMRVHAQDHRNLCVFGLSAPIVLPSESSFRCSGHFDPKSSRERTIL
jgi:hypothetical protein